MSLSGIGTVSITQGITQPSASSAARGGGGVSYSLGATSAGAYIAQGGGSSGGSLITKMLAGAVVGAGVGFGASFITPLLNLVPHAKILLPAAGAAIGALGGLALHFISKRNQNLAMQAQAQQQLQQQQGMQPVQISGATLRSGARGPAARKLQSDLKAIGLYDGRLTGAFDQRTADAVRRYEVMKGVSPTGQGSAEVRAAVAQDALLVRQYV